MPLAYFNRQTALVLRRRWAKRLVLLGAGGSLLARVSTIFIFTNRLRDISASDSLWAGIAVIPVLVIFLAALRVKSSEFTPRAFTPVARLDPAVATNRRKLDIGYASHLSVGLTGLVVSGLEWLVSVSREIFEGLALLALLFLTPLAMAAGLVGIVFSLIMWRDWRLPVLAVLGVSSILAGLAYEELGLTGSIPGSLAVAYVVASVAFSIRWFLFARRRLV